MLFLQTGCAVKNESRMITSTIKLTTKLLTIFPHTFFASKIKVSIYLQSIVSLMKMNFFPSIYKDHICQTNISVGYEHATHSL